MRRVTPQASQVRRQFPFGGPLRPMSVLHLPTSSHNQCTRADVHQHAPDAFDVVALSLLQLGVGTGLGLGCEIPHGNSTWPSMVCKAASMSWHGFRVSWCCRLLLTKRFEVNPLFFSSPLTSMLGSSPHRAAPFNSHGAHGLSSVCGAVTSSTCTNGLNPADENPGLFPMTSR